MDATTAQQILQQLPESYGRVQSIRAVLGGDINQAWQLTTAQGPLFVKTNQRSRLALFQQEVEGLKAIAQTQTIQTPKVLGWGQTSSCSFLVLEWLEAIPASRAHWQQLGEQLAALHQADVGQQFGWPSDNFIGHSPQLNQQHQSWAEFFAQQRIKPQLEWLKASLPAPIEAITEAIQQQLVAHQPKVSLLHGDLWSGNLMFTHSGPVLIDPACYWGDAAADVAMTRLFGGFDGAFYQAYQSHGGSAAEQWHPLYNLYHLLNHANLFGGHYLHQSLQALTKYL